MLNHQALKASSVDVLTSTIVGVTHLVFQATFLQLLDNIPLYHNQPLLCRSDAFCEELAGLLGTSTHTGLQALLSPLLLPCIQSFLAVAARHSPAQLPAEVPAEVPEASVSGEEFELRGNAWAMLGMLRLHLVAPPAGADPAGKYLLKAEHLERILKQDVLPQTQVSASLQVLPTAKRSPTFTAPIQLHA